MNTLKAAARSLKSIHTQNTGSDEDLDADLRCMPEHHDDDLQSMNEDLALLVEIFPDIPVDFIRRRVTRYSKESRRQLITEVLLSRDPAIDANQRQHVEKPEVKIKAVHDVKTDAAAQAPLIIRSEPYRAAVKTALCSEFSNVPRAKLDRVLAANAWSYTASREELLSSPQDGASSSKLVRMLSRWRRMAPPAERSPLINWPSKHDGDALPTVRPHVQDELARELNQQTIEPLRLARNSRQLALDRQIAEKLHVQEAETAGAMQDCACCFRSEPIDHMTACSEYEHFICYQCVRRTVSEAIFGQGWASSVDLAHGTVICIAVCSSDSCDGWIPPPQLQTALQTDFEGTQLLRRFDDELACSALRTADSDLLRCPSCPYAEISTSRKTKHSSATFITGLAVLCTSLTLGHAFAPTRLLKFAVATTLTAHLLALIISIIIHLQTRSNRPPATPKNTGQKFICRSPNCGAISCLTCLALWTDLHTCFKSKAQSLRLHVEAAASAAVKRTCPRCNLAFVKEHGCNHMTCRCGVEMCYVCKAKVPRDGGDHFCRHFQPHGGPCDRCSLCSLFEEVDLEECVRAARKRAEVEWWEMQRKGSGHEFVGLLERMRGTVGAGGGLLTLI